jgi:hypothetical protein
MRRTVLLAVETGELKPDTDPAQLVSELNGVMMTQLHDARFLRDPQAAERAASTWRGFFPATSPEPLNEARGSTTPSFAPTSHIVR